MQSKLLLAWALLANPVDASACEHLYEGTPPPDQATAPTLAEYDAALATLDMDAVKRDMTALLADSKECWPADFGNYGPFMVRLAWHCSGSFRASDGVGGCGGGRQRFEPERSWPDNTNLDKARALLYPLKEKYGNALSWGDLFILAGTTGLRDAGAPLSQMCFGRIDDTDGVKSHALGPTTLQAERDPCLVNGDCKWPLGATTVGLIYVNPEGPMGNPDPPASAGNIQTTFGSMGHSARNTVALIGGGHAVGKGHGACTTGAGLAPNEAYNRTPMATPWESECAAGTVTAGFEGQWTTNPLAWDNEYFTALLNNDWEKHIGPGGHWQWRISGETDSSSIFRLTSDIALLHDPEYLLYVRQFATDMHAFNTAFDDAWFDLTTTYGSGTWSENAKCDSGSLPVNLRDRPVMLSSDVEFAAASDTVSEDSSRSGLLPFAGVLSVAGLAFMFFKKYNQGSATDYEQFSA